MLAGIGGLYGLRTIGLLGLGPLVGGALPLQQLADDDAQPAARLLVVWLIAGGIAGRGLRWSGVESRVVTAALSGLVAWSVLAFTGALSDAAAISGGIAAHALDQFSRAGTWAGTALIALGSALAAPGPGRRAGPTA